MDTTTQTNKAISIANQLSQQIDSVTDELVERYLYTYTNRVFTGIHIAAQAIIYKNHYNMHREKLEKLDASISSNIKSLIGVEDVVTWNKMFALDLDAVNDRVRCLTRLMFEIFCILENIGEIDYNDQVDNLIHSGPADILDDSHWIMRVLHRLVRLNSTQHCAYVWTLGLLQNAELTKGYLQHVIKDEIQYILQHVGIVELLKGIKEAKAAKLLITRERIANCGLPRPVVPSTPRLISYSDAEASPLGSPIVNNVVEPADKVDRPADSPSTWDKMITTVPSTPEFYNGVVDIDTVQASPEASNHNDKPTDNIKNNVQPVIKNVACESTTEPADRVTTDAQCTAPDSNDKSCVVCSNVGEVVTEIAHQLESDVTIDEHTLDRIASQMYNSPEELVINLACLASPCIPSMPAAPVNDAIPCQNVLIAE
jgi:hypothetical protein